MAAKRRKSPSGTTQTYEERKDAGRRITTFALPDETNEEIDALAKAWKTTRTAVVIQAVRDAAQRRKV